MTRAGYKLPLRDKQHEKLIDIYSKNIRPKSLQKLVLLWYVLTLGDIRFEHIRGEILKRAGGFTYRGMVHALTPEEVMQILSCSRRTAIDYIETLKAITFHM